MFLTYGPPSPFHKLLHHNDGGGGQIPAVKGLAADMKAFSERIVHSKSYRSENHYRNKRISVIGNSASGHDVTLGIVKTVQLPVYQSRRTPARWDGNEPPEGVQWKPIVREYLPVGFGLRICWYQALFM